MKFAHAALVALVAFASAIGSISGQAPSPRESDAYLILFVVAECVKEFHLDRVTTSAPVQTSDDREVYIQRALSENIALKHCQKARSLLQPVLQVNDTEIKTLLESLDGSFEGQERMHRQMLQIIDRISSGSGHTSGSEVGKIGADAIEVLDQFTKATTELFAHLAPALPLEERGLLADKISTLFKSEDEMYSGDKSQIKLPQEVWMILQFRDVLRQGRR